MTYHTLTTLYKKYSIPGLSKEIPELLITEIRLRDQQEIEDFREYCSWNKLGFLQGGPKNDKTRFIVKVK